MRCVDGRRGTVGLPVGCRLRQLRGRLPARRCWRTPIDLGHAEVPIELEILREARSALHGVRGCAGPGAACSTWSKIRRRSRAWRRAATGIVSPVRSTSVTSFSSDSKPMSVLRHQVCHHHVAVLGFAACGALPATRFSVSAAKPISSRSPFLRPSSARMSGVGSSSSDMRAAVFLTFCFGGFAQMIIGHRRGLDDDGRCLRDAPSPRRAFRRAVRTWITSTPRGAVKCTGPEIRITRRRARPPLRPARNPSCRWNDWRCSAPDRAAPAWDRR